MIDRVQIFSPIPYSLSLPLVWMVSCVGHKLFSWMQAHWFIFTFVACTFGVKKKKIITKMNISELFFFLLGLLWFQVFILSWFCVCGVKLGSATIVFHVGVSTLFLKSLSFPQCESLAPLSSICWTRVWVYFWAPYSVPLVCVSVVLPVLCCLITTALW